MCGGMERAARRRRVEAVQSLKAERSGCDAAPFAQPKSVTAKKNASFSEIGVWRHAATSRAARRSLRRPRRLAGRVGGRDQACIPPARREAP